jgi:hypothetical protein
MYASWWATWVSNVGDPVKAKAHNEQMRLPSKPCTYKAIVTIVFKVNTNRSICTPTGGQPGLLTFRNLEGWNPTCKREGGFLGKSRKRKLTCPKGERPAFGAQSTMKASKST